MLYLYLRPYITHEPQSIAWYISDMQTFYDNPKYFDFELNFVN